MRRYRIVVHSVPGWWCYLRQQHIPAEIGYDVERKGWLFWRKVDRGHYYTTLEYAKGRLDELKEMEDAK